MNVVEMGASPLAYDYGRPNRIGIIDPSLPPAPRGDVYFTEDPVPSREYERKLREFERGDRKTKPRMEHEENSGTAQRGLASFLDWSYSGDAIFIHFMATRQDARGRGYGTALVDWIYAKAQREGRTVDWGKVFYPAQRIFDGYRGRYPDMTRGRYASREASFQQWQDMTGTNGQVPDAYWDAAEFVPVATLSALSLHQRPSRRNDLGPIDPDTTPPVLIAWNPYTGQGNLSDGNHRVARAAQEGVAALRAVVWVCPDLVFGTDPVISDRVPVNHFGPQQFPNYSIVPPSAVPAPKLRMTAKTLDEALQELAEVIVQTRWQGGSSSSIFEAPERAEPDWAPILARYTTMYRGLALRLDPDDVAHLFDPQQSVNGKVDLLLAKLRGSLGMYWTVHRGEAAGFAGMSADPGDVRVILHAAVPKDPAVIDTDRAGHGYTGWDDNYGEQEITLRPGAPVTITHIEWAPGGPRPMLRSDDGGGWMGAAVSTRKSAARTKFSDFEVGQRVVVKGHPDEPGTITSIHGQHNVYTKGYITISFDSDPDRPAQYPWREVEIIGGPGSVTAAILPQLYGFDTSQLDTSQAYFLTVATPSTLSGWKAHIYCESADDVRMAWARVKSDIDAFDWGAKLATARFFEFAQPGHKQYGKGVTIYFPRRETWEDDLSWLVEVMRGWPSRLCKPIAGDNYVDNGVSWRFEFTEDPGEDVPIADAYHLYKPAAMDPEVLRGLTEITHVPPPSTGEVTIERVDSEVASVAYIARLDARGPIGQLWIERRDDGVYEIQAVSVHPDYRRQGIATRMLERARADLVRVEHAPEKDRTKDGLAWSRSVGSLTAAYYGPEVEQAYRERVRASGGIVYRGLKVVFPPEIKARLDELAEPPTEEHEIGRSEGIAKLLLDYLQTAHPYDSSVGLGRHWTTRKEMAETAAYQGGPPQGVGFVITARFRESDVDWEMRPGTQTHGEDEITLKPGAQVEVLDVEFPFAHGYKGVRTMPQGTTLRYTAGTTEKFKIVRDGPDRWTLLAGRSGDWYDIGYLKLVDGVLDEIQIDAAYRRQGLATMLVDHVRSEVGEIRFHTDPGEYTPAGAAFIETIGRPPLSGEPGAFWPYEGSLGHRTASSRTLYRGVRTVKLDRQRTVELWEAVLAGRTADFARSMLGREVRTDNVGRSWTSDLDTARNFANAGAVSSPRAHTDEIPVVLYARVPESSLMADPTQVPGYRMNGWEEFEVPLDSGSPAQVFAIELGLPNDGDQLRHEHSLRDPYAAYDPSVPSVFSTDDIRWERFDIAPVTVTAARGDQYVTLYRGLTLDSFNPDEFVDALGSGGLDRFVIDALAEIERGDRTPGMGVGQVGQGIGVHWSRDRSIAQSFAAKFGNSLSLGLYGYLPMVIEVRADMADAMDPSEIHAFEWNGRDEQEVGLRPGSPVQVTRVWMMVPSDAGGFVAAYDENGEARTDRVRWHEVSVARSAVAKTAELDNEGRVSVAEHVMENFGYTGKVWQLKGGHVDDPEYQATMAPLRQFVAEVVGEYVNVHVASDYVLKYEMQGVQAMVTGIGTMYVRETVSTLTVLHECAHIINRSTHGEGHDDGFIRTAADLYGRYLGPAAKEKFLEMAVNVWKTGDLSASAALGGSKLWWRIHPAYRDFSPESATSTPINNWMDEAPQRGFSAVGNPWHLWVYAANMGWLSERGPSKAWNDDVIAFTGEMRQPSDGRDRDSYGHDGEPLVVPDMRIVQRFSWQQFEDELLRTPFPAGPMGGRAYEGEDAIRNGRWSWPEFAQSLLGGKQQGNWNDNDRAARVANFIIEHWIGSGTARTASSDTIVLYHGTSGAAAQAIMRSGLNLSKSPRMTLTESFDVAAEFARVRKPLIVQDRTQWIEPDGHSDMSWWDPAVVRIEIPAAEASQYLGQIEDYYISGHATRAYHLSQPIPARYVKGVTELDLPDGMFSGRPTYERYAALSGRMYHLTNQLDFRLDPKRRPANNTTLGGDWEPSIFLTKQPEHWINGYGYRQPWVVEFDTSRLTPDDIVFETSYETLVRASAYDRLTILRVLPLDGFAREEYGEYGWTEEHFGTDAFTGEPIPADYMAQRQSYPTGWRSPDARTMPSAWTDEYKKRVTKYRQQVGRGAYASKTAGSIYEVDPEGPMIHQAELTVTGAIAIEGEDLLSDIERDRLHSGLAIVPQAHLDLLRDRGIRIVVDPNDHSAHYVPGDRAITIRPGMASAIVHEIGHAVDFARGLISGTAAWAAIAKDRYPDFRVQGMGDRASQLAELWAILYQVAVGDPQRGFYEVPGDLAQVILDTRTVDDLGLRSKNPWTAGVRTAKFDSAQLATWESTKPWNLSKEEAVAQTVEGWWHKSQRGSEAASYEQGWIRPTDDFYALPEEARRAVAYHEAGHAMLEAAGGLGVLDDPLSIIDLPGGRALGYNAEEIIAEAYSVLWTEPEWFDRMAAHEIRSITIDLAERAGFPLPPQTRFAAFRPGNPSDDTWLFDR